MKRFPKIGDEVRILNDIGKDLNDDRVGIVTNRDGEYIYIRLNKSNVIVERYINELEPVS